MSKETFEEWFKSDGNGDFDSFSKDYYAGQWAPLIKHAWNHQQKKIDELEGEVEGLKKKLIESGGQSNMNTMTIKTLTAQIELLTRCIYDSKNNGRTCSDRACLPCKNKAMLKEGV